MFSYLILDMGIFAGITANSWCMKVETSLSFDINNWKKRFSKAAHWVLVAKSGMNNLKNA